MKFILQDQEIKLTNQLLGGFNLFLVSNEDDNLSYMLTFPGLEDVTVEFLNLPDWLSYNDVTKELSGTPDGNNAGNLLLNFKVTHKTGESNETLEIVVNSTVVLGEGTTSKFTLPVFDQLRTHADLSDALIEDSAYGNPGVNLNSDDLTGTNSMMKQLVNLQIIGYSQMKIGKILLEIFYIMKQLWMVKKFQNQEIG